MFIFKISQALVAELLAFSVPYSASLVWNSYSLHLSTSLIWLMSIGRRLVVLLWWNFWAWGGVFSTNYYIICRRVCNLQVWPQGLFISCWNVTVIPCNLKGICLNLYSPQDVAKAIFSLSSRARGIFHCPFVRSNIHMRWIWMIFLYHFIKVRHWIHVEFCDCIHFLEVYEKTCYHLA